MIIVISGQLIAIQCSLTMTGESWVTIKLHCRIYAVKYK